VGLAAFFIDGFALDEESLADVWEFQIAIEFGRGPYFTGFNSAMIRRVVLNEIGLFSVFEKQRDILKKTGLVVFDGEVVVAMALPDDIVGDRALGDQGVGGDFFAFDIYGIKQGDGGFDFVGSFQFLASLYRQASDFFWV